MVTNKKTTYKKDPEKLSFYGISIGRVQNPILRTTIEKFLNPIINGKGLDLKKSLSLKDINNNIWEFKDNKKYEKDIKKLEKAFEILNKSFNKGNKELIIESITTKLQKPKRPEPLTLSKLQSECLSMFGIQPKEVMRIAQTLYEKGFTSYPRTDSITVPENILKKIKSILGNKFKDFGYKDKGEFVQEGHHAIVFVNKGFNFDGNAIKFNNIGLNSKQQNVYELIVKRTLAAFYSDDLIISKRFIDGKYTIKEKSSLLFTINDQKVKEKGWLILYDYIQKKYNELFKNIKKGDVINIKEIFLKDINIKISTNIGINKLKNDLLKNGISRPSTFAPILETVKNKDLIKINGANLSALPKGVRFWFLLKNEFEKNKYFDTFDFELTRWMENELDNIFQGKKDHIKLMNEILLKFKPYL